MLRSLYSAVSGVKAHQTYLDVTGNNIANVNTVGFKRDVIHFRDMIYQSVKNPSAPNNGVPIGGINPAQVGLGVGVGSIETIHTGGSLQTTGIPTDMAISGNGFFVVKNGTQQLYTRAGNFALDRDGNLVMQGNGYLVQGYRYGMQYDSSTGTTRPTMGTELGDVNISIGEKLSPKETTLLAFRCNLDCGSTPRIEDVNNVPLGNSKVNRPHDYAPEGTIEVSYVGTTTPASPKSGEYWYDTTTGQGLKRYNGNAWETVAATEKAYYYGTNLSTATASAADFPTVYHDYKTPGNTGVVAKLSMVDYAGTTQPATPASVGLTWLNTANGKIYKSISGASGPEWEAAATATDMAADTAYGVKGGTNGESFVKVGSAAFSTTANVMNSANHQMYRWDGAANDWTLFPYDNGGLYPTAASTTTKANFEAYASDITQSYDHPTKITVYDSKGNEYSLETVFRKAVKKPGDPNATPPTAAEIEWDWYSYYVGADGKPLEPSPGVGAGTLVFGDDGLLKRTYYYDPAQLSTMLSSSDPNATADLIEVTIDSDGVPRDENGAAVTGKVGADFNKYGAEGSVVPGNPNAEPPTGTTYAPNFIELDFLGYSAGKALGVTKEPIDGVTGFASASTTKGYYQDGYTMGVLENFSVAQDGTITGSYSNGEMIPIAQIALATFQNQQGLLQVGETCFAESVNSGMADIGAPMTGGSGSIIGNTIEMSNVDLSEEFVNLIRAQRGFQASTRVVTTSDQVLEELINMKR